MYDLVHERHETEGEHSHQHRPRDPTDGTMSTSLPRSDPPITQRRDSHQSEGCAHDQRVDEKAPQPEQEAEVDEDQDPHRIYELVQRLPMRSEPTLRALVGSECQRY